MICGHNSIPPHLSLPQPVWNLLIFVFVFFLIESWHTRRNSTTKTPLIAWLPTYFFGLTSSTLPLAPLHSHCVGFQLHQISDSCFSHSPPALSLRPPSHPCSHALIFQIPNPSSLLRKAFPHPHMESLLLSYDMILLQNAIKCSFPFCVWKCFQRDSSLEAGSYFPNPGIEPNCQSTRG